MNRPDILTDAAGNSTCSEAEAAQQRKTGRTARIGRHHSGRPSVKEVAAYLPSNYMVIQETPEAIVIWGEDHHGWTLDEYVIPRLASGLIHAEEVTS